MSNIPRGRGDKYLANTTIKLNLEEPSKRKYFQTKQKRLLILRKLKFLDSIFSGLPHSKQRANAFKKKQKQTDYWWTNWSQHAGWFEKMKDFISSLLVQTAFRMDSATREWNSNSPNWILKTGEGRDQMLSVLLVQRQASLHLGGNLCQPPAQTTLKWQQSSNCCIFSAGMPLDRVSPHINSNTNPKKQNQQLCTRVT